MDKICWDKELNIWKLNKECIIDIINKIVLPFSEELLSDKRVKHLLTNEQILKHDLGIVKLTVEILRGDEKLIFERLKSASEAHNDIQELDKEILREYLNRYFSLLLNYSKKCNFSVNLKEQIPQYEEFFMSHYKIDNDNFFDFDSEEVDEAIEQMHYKDEQKISAKEFCNSGELDEDMLHDINDAIAESEELDITDGFNENFKENAIRVFNAFERVFSIHYDFRDISYALTVLIQKLQNIDITSLDDMQKEFYFTVLNAIKEDLISWHKVVLDEQIAQDIHYMDASLLANIAQIDIMLEQISSDKNSPKEDEFELF